MTAGSVGVFGKVPAQADFFKCNAGDFARLGLDRWFQEAHEVVHGERGRIPAEPAFFLLAPFGTRTVLLGALAPGQDAVGRSFPLIVFTTLDAAGFVDSFPLAPTAYGAFFEAAAGLLERAPSMTAAELTAAVQAMPAVTPDRGAEGTGLLARELLAPLGLGLGGLPHGAAYAFKTLLSACDQARQPAGGGATKSGVITVDAPAPTDASRLLWLELVRRRLGLRDAVPSFVWTRRASSRLLVTLGPPSPSFLAFLANPNHRSPRFWPLRTEVASALDAAVQALTPDQRRALETPGETLAGALAAFG